METEFSRRGYGVHMQLPDDGKKLGGKWLLVAKTTEMRQEPSFGLVSFVVSTGNGLHGVVWDDGGYGFLPFILGFRHPNVLFSFNQLGRESQSNPGWDEGT
jgi:hypothetical protein